MATIGYVRVSDEDQNQDLQIDALKDAGCEQIYCDHGVSGSVQKREGLNSALDVLSKGDTLVVWKFDRLGRSAAFLLLLAEEFKEKGIKLKSVTEGIDALSRDGKLNYGIRALFAEQERDSISERTRAGMQAARRRGKHIGRPRKLTPAQVSTLKALIPTLPYEQHQDIANQYRISLKTLQRAVSFS